MDEMPSSRIAARVSIFHRVIFVPAIALASARVLIVLKKALSARSERKTCARTIKTAYSERARRLC